MWKSCVCLREGFYSFCADFLLSEELEKATQQPAERNFGSYRQSDIIDLFTFFNITGSD